VEQHRLTTPAKRHVQQRRNRMHEILGVNRANLRGPHALGPAAQRKEQRDEAAHQCDNADHGEAEQPPRVSEEVHELSFVSRSSCASSGEAYGARFGFGRAPASSSSRATATWSAFLLPQCTEPSTAQPSGGLLWTGSISLISARTAG